MKKTLIASAIAAISFSGTALAMENASDLAARMDSMPTVYGNIQYVLKNVDVEGAGSSIEHADNGSTLGVKHEHKIAPGLTGFFKLELDGFGADEKGSQGSKIDEAYIGVKSDSFGQILVGSDDGVYERAVVKIGNFHEVGSDIFNAGTTGEGDQIQYQSPSFGGLVLGAGVQINGDGESAGASKSYPYQLSATYAVDALSLAVAMDSNESAVGSNENTYGLLATYNMGDLSVSGEYQTRSDDKDIFGVIGVYTMGANQFSLSYQVQDVDATDDKNDTIVLQALHNVSDNLYVYAEGYFSTADGATFYADPDGTSAAGDEQTIAGVGAVYYF
ncbi:membrane protein [Marinobacter psychrophilus]|uniref:Membrane protein n=1 Tax=Marinobacter psychrophilus TaxID=330734 RepID=A0A0H4HXZ7_9GAMM|nr:porin [Marinobacter psychrophilus]AKO51584.1 membrane protein [Marinobacter psychrophilus]